MANIHYVYIYLDTRPNKMNEPLYVGKGTRKINSRIYKRAVSHWREGSGNIVFHRVLDKIRLAGLEPTIKIVGEFETESEAFEYEQQLIKLYGRRDLDLGSLLNLTDGGEGCLGQKFDKAHKKQISERFKKYWKQDGKRLEQGKRFSNYWKDPNLRSSRIKLMRERAKERWANPEERVKLSEQNKLRWRKEGYIEKVGPKISVGIKNFYKTKQGEKLKNKFSKLLRKGTTHRKAIDQARWTPEAKVKQAKFSRETLEKIRYRPEVEQKLREGRRKRWADPEWRAFMLKRQAEGRAKRKLMNPR